jgi:hypothetical protein
MTKVTTANQISSNDERLAPRKPFHSLIHQKSSQTTMFCSFSHRVKRKGPENQNRLTNQSGSSRKVLKNVLVPAKSSCKINSKPNMKNARCRFRSLGHRASHAALHHDQKTKFFVRALRESHARCMVSGPKNKVASKMLTESHPCQFS